jgi:Zn-dependent protease
VSLEELLPTLVAVAIFIAVAFPVHEFSHAFAAFRLGDSTARYQGRLTLNPIVHFDPLGGLILIVTALLPGSFLIGWAKPTPVNPYNLQGGRRGEALVALAGPISNLIMALAVAAPMRLIVGDDTTFGTILGNDAARFAFETAYMFVVINVVLMIFNLLPIAPLDGWRVVLGLVDARTAYSLRQFEQYGFIVLIVLVIAGGSILGGLINGVTRFLLGL